MCWTVRAVEEDKIAFPSMKGGSTRRAPWKVEGIIHSGLDTLNQNFSKS